MTLTLATITALLVPATVLIAISILACRRLTAMHRQSTVLPDWPGDVTVDRYRPMLRLLEEDDMRFLRAQPGVTEAMVARLRSQRCQIFRGYLRCLELDFQDASRCLMAVLMQSQTDRADLIPVLLKSRIHFTTGLFIVRCRLLLYRWNLRPAPVARLVQLFEGLQLELLASHPAAGSARIIPSFHRAVIQHSPDS